MPSANGVGCCGISQKRRTQAEGICVRDVGREVVPVDRPARTAEMLRKAAETKLRPGKKVKI